MPDQADADAAALALVDRLTEAPRLSRRAVAMERLDGLLAELPDGHALHGLVESAPVGPLLAALADHSPFLWRLAAQDPGRLARLLASPPWISLERCLDAMDTACATAASARDAMPALRRARAEVALLVALADIGGAWDLDQVTEALTRFADRAVAAAVDTLLGEAGALSKLLPAIGAPSDGSGLVVLAMGKGGARELNYSSDIDLVVFYEPAASRLAPETVPAPFYVRLVQGLVRLLSEPTGDGHVLRVDLRLRPDPGSTAVAVSLPAAFAYYESFGQNWERAAFIKARPVAGDLALGARVLADLAPFVWRRYFDYAAIADVHAMKRQIHAVRGHAAVTVAGHDLKIGRGGIREVEFFVQTQQLIFGGRRPPLRGSRTLPMLSALAADGWIGADAVADLGDAYRLLRRIEHRLQMIDDRQTQRLPADPETLRRLALFSGYDGYDAFAAALTVALRAVETHYARLFEQAPGLDAEAGSLVFSGDAIDPATVETLRELRFTAPEAAVETVRGWHFGRRPAVRTPRAREVLTELVPGLLQAFARSGDPDAALRGFDTALGRLPAAVELFGILRANAALRELYADLLGVAPKLAATVATSPHLLDAAIDPALQRDPDPAEIERRVAGAGPETEAVLDRAREVAREEGFLIGLRLLAGTLAPARAGVWFSDLAGAILRALLAQVERGMAAEHGRVPDGRLVVVAMGKLGSREMTAASDLDLILVYDHDLQHAESDGIRPLEAPRYFARLAQRLIAALTVATRRGPLYQVDLRLRPSGNQGPLATRLSGFARYQREEAETWERMALTRARVVAGNRALAGEVEGIVRETLSRPGGDGLGAEISALRRLVEDGKPHAGAWDLKLAPGAQLDLEFLAQYLVLRHAAGHPTLLGCDTMGTLVAARDLGLVGWAEGDALVAAATLFTDLTQVMRLCHEGRFDPETAGDGLKRRLYTAVGLPDFATLDRHLTETRGAVSEVFEMVLGADTPRPSGEEVPANRVARE